MKRPLIATIGFLFSVPAFAQQQPVPTVAETAIQITNIIGQWSQTLVQQAKLIEQLQKENEALKKQTEEKEKK